MNNPHRYLILLCQPIPDLSWRVKMAKVKRFLFLLPLLLAGCSGQSEPPAVEPSPAAPVSAAPTQSPVVIAPTQAPTIAFTAVPQLLNPQEQAWLDNAHEAFGIVEDFRTSDPFDVKQVATYEAAFGRSQSLYEQVPAPPRFFRADSEFRSGYSKMSEALLQMEVVNKEVANDDTDSARALGAAEKLVVNSKRWFSEGFDELLIVDAELKSGSHPN